MGEIHDLKQSVLSLKADEKMIGFVGFEVDGDRISEGILKISGFFRDDDSGYLTLTFVVDTKDEPGDRDRLRQAFAALEQGSLRRHLGDNLEMLMAVPLDSLSAGRDWFIGEWNVYFRKLRGGEQDLIQRQLLPALRRILPFTFAPIQWWSEASNGEDMEPLQAGRPATISRLKALFRGCSGR